MSNSARVRISVRSDGSQRHRPQLAEPPYPIELIPADPLHRVVRVKQIGMAAMSNSLRRITFAFGIELTHTCRMPEIGPLKQNRRQTDTLLRR